MITEAGSIFVHCDLNATHIICTLLDEIFGASQLRAEIIWSYKRWSNAKKGLLPSHQTIYFYTKSDHFKFNTIYHPYSMVNDESLPIAESSQVRVMIILTDDSQTQPETQQITDYSSALADNIKQALAQLDLLTENELWQAAQLTIAREKTDAMQVPVEKQQREGLTDSENQQALLLSHFFNRAMLVRAKAAALLKKRGYDISTLITETENE